MNIHVLLLDKYTSILDSNNYSHLHCALFSPFLLFIYLPTLFLRGGGGALIKTYKVKLEIL